VAGHDLHFIDDGAEDGAPAVVLLSSQWLNARSFSRFATALSPRYRLVCVDLPGQGLTAPAPHGDHSATAYAAVIEALVARLALTSYVLVGTSFIAIAAALHAATRPAGLAGLVLATASGLRRRQDGPGPNLPPPDSRLSALREGRRSLEFFEWKLRSLLARAMPDDELASHVREAAVMNELPGRTLEAERRVRAHDSDLMSRTLPLLDVPALVQWSSDSTYLPPDMATSMAAMLASRPAVHVYPRTGHLLLIDAPEEVARDVSRFVDSLDVGRTGKS
jgi:pimeloyl-ACP methyl ester carboxylesterase